MATATEKKGSSVNTDTQFSDDLVRSLQDELEKKKTSLKRAQTLAKNRLNELNTLKKKYEAQENAVKSELTEQIELMRFESNQLKFSLISKEEENKNLHQVLEKLELQMKTLVKSNGEIQKENLRIIEDYKKIDRERLHLSNEVRRFRSDLEKMKGSPLLLGTVITTLDGSHVAVRSSAGPQLVVSVSADISPEDLLPGTNVGMNQQTFAIAKVFPVFEEPDVAAMELIEECDITYDQIGGLDAQIKEIQEVVELPLTKPHLFEQIGIEPPGGALLYGPPGTGKTMIAKAVANRTNATFMRVVGSELVQKYIGDGAKMVHELFEMAREKAPSIIFIDEIDSIASKRIDDTTGADREIHRTLMQLLAEMDGFTRLSDVKIIGATNRIDILDSAILRPGRFDRIIYVPLPDAAGRLSILKIHTRKMNLSKDIDLNLVSAMTEGASGADVKAIVTEAGMFAIRSDRNIVLQEDFADAVSKVMAKKRPDTMPVPEHMFL